MAANGQCACGAVRFRVRATLRDVANCHCDPCRRITGHFMAATATATEALDIDDETSLQWYDRTETVAYGFCRICGSTLFWRDATNPGQISIAAGTLNTPTGLTTSMAIFVADASDYHRLDHQIRSVDGDSAIGLSDD